MFGPRWRDDSALPFCSTHRRAASSPPSSLGDVEMARRGAWRPRGMVAGREAAWGAVRAAAAPFVVLAPRAAAPTARPKYCEMLMWFDSMWRFRWRGAWAGDKTAGASDDGRLCQRNWCVPPPPTFTSSTNAHTNAHLGNQVDL